MLYLEVVFSTYDEIFSDKQCHMICRRVFSPQSINFEFVNNAEDPPLPLILFIKKDSHKTEQNTLYITWDLSFQ